MYSRSKINQILIFQFLRAIFIYRIRKKMKIMEYVSIYLNGQITRTV